MKTISNFAFVALCIFVKSLFYFMEYIVIGLVFLGIWFFNGLDAATQYSVFLFFMIPVFWFITPFNNIKKKEIDEINQIMKKGI